MSRDSANFETEGDNRVIITPYSNTCCSFVTLSSKGTGVLDFLIKGLHYFLSPDNNSNMSHGYSPPWAIFRSCPGELRC